MGNSEKTRKPGWHSTRHQTSEAHDAARARYVVHGGRVGRQRRAAERLGLSVPRGATSDDLRALLRAANDAHAPEGTAS